MKPRVISYVRFSSARQSKGRSEERQGDAAERWCAQHGMKLDESVADLGLSAFTGKHRTKGNLAAFLEQVEEGRVPKGSYLLIEHFDRLSREEIDDADTLVKSILRKDVNIVTLLDGHIYTKKSLNNIAALIGMMLAFAQAHEESFRKGGRVSETFKRKREEGKKVFGSAPGWLRRSQAGGDWEVVEELAESVRKVFEAAGRGMGGPTIAKLANAEGWPVPTRVTSMTTEHWHSRMPQIILKNRAVLGEAQHKLKGKNVLKELESDVPVAVGPPIKDYYPRVISDDLWHLARSSVQTRKTAPPKRDGNYFHVFSGLLRCGHCGASIQRKVEYRGWSRAQLICSSKAAGITKCKTMSALKTEAQVILDICAYAGAHLGLGYDKDAAVKEVAVAESKLADVKTAIANVVAVSRAVGAVPEVLQDIARLTAEREQLENVIEELKAQLAVNPNSLFDTAYAEQVIAVLFETSDDAMRLRADCNNRLRRAVDVIWLWAYDLVAVQFKNSQQLLTIPLGVKAQGDAQPAWAASLKGELELPSLKKS
ncbi:recombinase family protein [Roseateles asaccharophilus]|uniref:DNA invertase Pin-like site-specific DNA recombinase n=1 Tax=Roseateles asaccharophilus TaxID=582607 RepID=A0ABU2ACF7_9BURK|nr:recombinase family protein [Roseateles asaccharophilus]MDR7334288.1 DNA invertase Pin-like site-specific DNA recombinase [Roseateles asaccharophilus]